MSQNPEYMLKLSLAFFVSVRSTFLIFLIAIGHICHYISCPGSTIDRSLSANLLAHRICVTKLPSLWVSCSLQIASSTRSTQPTLEPSCPSPCSTWGPLWALPARIWQKLLPSWGPWWRSTWVAPAVRPAAVAAARERERTRRVPNRKQRPKDVWGRSSQRMVARGSEKASLRTGRAMMSEIIAGLPKASPVASGITWAAVGFWFRCRIPRRIQICSLLSHGREGFLVMWLLADVLLFATLHIVTVTIYWLSNHNHSLVLYLFRRFLICFWLRSSFTIENPVSTQCDSCDSVWLWLDSVWLDMERFTVASLL